MSLWSWIPSFFSVTTILIALTVARAFVVIVPARKRAVVERNGKFSQVVEAGVHVFIPGIDMLRQVKWTYVDQEGSIHKAVDDVFVSEDRMQMDIEPVECLSKDQIRITVDLTAMYRVTDLKQASYGVDDATNFFFQCLRQTVRNVVANSLIEDLNGKDAELGVKIMNGVNSLMKQKVESGLCCESVMIQGVEIDEEILQRNQAIFSAKRQAEMTIEKNRTEHEAVMWNLKSQAELQKTEDGLRREAAIRAAEIGKLETLARMEREEIVMTTAKKLGFTHDQLIERDRVEAMRAFNAKCKSRIVFAPTDFWSTPHSLKIPK